MDEIKEKVQDFLTKNPEPKLLKVFDLLFSKALKESKIDEEYFKQDEVNDLVKKLNNQ